MADNLNLYDPLKPVKIIVFKGRITLEKCKKYKLKKEEAEEVAELDVSKIIGTPGTSQQLKTRTHDVIFQSHIG